MFGCGSLQMVSESIIDFGLGVCFTLQGICLFGPAIPWDTTKTFCLHGGVFVISHIEWGRKFLILYNYELLLTM